MGSERFDGDNVPVSRRQLLATLGGSFVTGSLAGCREDAPEPTGPPRSANPGRTTTTSGVDATTRLSERTSATATADVGADGSRRDPIEGTWEEGGPPDRSNWSVTFQDAFDDGLDWDVWELGFGPSSEHPCAGSACARRENVRVEGDRLVLETTPAGADEVPNDVWLADWTTGAVTTGESFAQTFGYFEAKAKIPSQPGGLPAFWAWADHGNPPEIDFYEVFGPSPSTVTTTVHVDCNGNGELLGRGANVDVEGRVDDAFRVFGCAWTPEAVAWYVDGVEVHREDGFYYDECHTPEPMFPVLNTHVVGGEGDFVGPDQVGDPTEADYPYTHEFEWVRVWQREDLESQA